MKRPEAIQNMMFELESLTEAEKDDVLQRLVQKKYEAKLKERVGLEQKRMVGRPSRMQPEVVERLLLALRSGASISMSCSFAGISYELFRIWSKKARTYQDTLKKVTEREIEAEANGQDPLPLTPFESGILVNPSKETIDCVELFVLVDQAIAECGVRDLNAITKAAQNGAWTAAAFRLSKRFKEDWGTEADSTNVNVNVGFGYVEINKAVNNVAEPKQINAANEQAMRAIELNVIDVEAEDIG